MKTRIQVEFHYVSRFEIGNKVSIDGCSELNAIVTGLSFRTGGYHTVECSWVSGSSQSAWFEEWRLEKIDG